MTTELTTVQKNTLKAVTDHKGTTEEFNAFEYIITDSLDKVSHKACEAYYHIGAFMIKLSENYSQAEAKEIRETYFVGAGLVMTRNESSACKQIAKAFQDAHTCVQAYEKTGTRSINAARIWATLNKKDTAEATLEEKIKAKFKAIEAATKSALDLIKQLKDDGKEIEFVQTGLGCLGNQTEAINKIYMPLKTTEAYQLMLDKMEDEKLADFEEIDAVDVTDDTLDNK